MTPVTLADVAREAGCSAKTVSNVVLGRPGASAETRVRVLDAVSRLGYIGDPAGRQLASGRTGRVAIVVPRLYQPYFAETAERLVLEIEGRGMTSTLVVAHDLETELRAVTAARDVDGVILCPHAVTDEMLDVTPPNRPTVQLGAYASRHFDRVVMGEYEGFRRLAGHLLAQGRRRIALIWSGEEGSEPRGPRFDGYRDALADAGIRHDPELVAFGSDWDRRASGFEAMTALLATGRRFDAALCVNDAMAIGAMRVLRTRGVRVPDDVAVTGFDDTVEGAFLVPALTSASPRGDEMVAAAVRMLVERIEGYDGPLREVQTGADLVVRASA
ncbi:LacI family DNA-binding transcriptional regulator [Microbacterium gilvum]|jgi:DNA-binding LacI/PurR family transcriptional regulator|uniref:LacI family DNA-binding transcriptional regulator n=1 Tax=Microbacterium gilvum TaxID=1336204 RepID=A0ABP9AKC8_9MICO